MAHRRDLPMARCELGLSESLREEYRLFLNTGPWVPATPPRRSDPADWTATIGKRLRSRSLRDILDPAAAGPPGECLAQLRVARPFLLAGAWRNCG